MITVDQIQVALDAIRAENRLLRRLVERQKRSKQRLTEGDGEYEYKGYERPTFAVPGLDEVLDGVEDEASELVARYRL